MVTAGLKWPPEMCPKAKMAASRPSPNANGTTSRPGVCRRGSREGADRRVAERQEQERSRAVPPDTRGCSSSLPWSPSDADGVSGSHHTEAGPCGANQQRVARRPAQHLDELQSIHRGRRGPARRRRPRVARGRPRAGSGSGGSVRAAAMRAASSSLPISPNGTNGRRGRWKAVSGRSPGSGCSPATVSAIDAGRWAWTTAAMSGRAAWRARWIARSEVGDKPARRARGHARRGRARSSTRSARPRAHPCADPSGRRGVGRDRGGSRDCPRPPRSGRALRDDVLPSAARRRPRSCPPAHRSGRARPPAGPSGPADGVTPSALTRS